jgi:hypothetical protein
MTIPKSLTKSMTMKERIVEVWDDLLQQNAQQKGFVKTLIDPSLLVAVYLAILFPIKSKAFLIDFSEAPKSRPKPFVGRGMKLEWLSRQENQKELIVMLTVTDEEFLEVFTVFLEDCINAIAVSRNKVGCLKIFSDRLNIWRKLLETYIETGLTANAQQGLFGELIVLLRLFRQFTHKTLELLIAWQGPDKFHKDFFYQNWAIEVKTSSGVDSVSISSEAQLSSSGLRHLYLWHLVLERHQGQGATLNDLVAEVRSQLYQREAIALFNIRLAGIGYYDHQSSLYESMGYFIRQERQYNVIEGFPSLTIQNIPSPVSEVKYTLNLSACTAFIIPEEVIYSNLNL